METKWFCTQQGRSQGPFPEDQLKKMIASGQLQPSDYVWPEISSVQITVATYKRLNTGTVPTWLDDVRKVESAPSASAPGGRLPSWFDDVMMAESNPVQDIATKVPPNWLEDVRALEDLPPRKNQPSSQPKERKIPLYWLEDIREIEESLASVKSLPSAPKAELNKKPPQVSPPKPTARPQERPQVQPPKTAPSPKPKQVEPAALPPIEKKPQPTIRPTIEPPVKPQPLPHPAAKPPVAEQRPTPPSEPEPLISTPSVPKATPQATEPVKHPTEKPFEGRQQEQRVVPQPANRPIFEVFLEARRRLEDWADADENKQHVMASNFEVICDQPAIQAVFDTYANYGDVMRDKLFKHLYFLVDNRKKFYIAFANK